jgi:hypothetical protein
MPEQTAEQRNGIDADDGSIAWAIARLAEAVDGDDPAIMQRALNLAVARIHDTTIVLSDLLGELRFAYGSRLATTPGAPMHGECEDAMLLATEYLQLLAARANITGLAQPQRADEV